MILLREGGGTASWPTKSLRSSDEQQKYCESVLIWEADETSTAPTFRKIGGTTPQNIELEPAKGSHRKQRFLLH